MSPAPALRVGDYVVMNPRGPEIPMRVTEVGNGWVELMSEPSGYRFRMETVLVVKANA